MIHTIFTVYDVKANAYLPPFFMHQIGMATRMFADCVNDPKHQFGRNPHDYTLFNIGTYDDLHAQLDPHAPESLGNGLEFVGDSHRQVEITEIIDLKEAENG